MMEHDGFLLTLILWIIFVSGEQVIPIWCCLFSCLRFFREIFNHIGNVVIHGELYFTLFGEVNGHS